MRNIVICCDGTGNEYGTNNTNVVLTYMACQKNKEQLAFYDPGVGTGGWEYNESTGDLKAKSDQATGGGLQKNVEDAYRYLMQVYRENDRIFLFGFSRGAFTVRSLAGMLYKCGLLDAGHDNHLEYASKIYNTADNKDIAKGFKETFCRPCPVFFIGVWDTVSSLIMSAGKRFHNPSLNPAVKFGYHALAIDERRKDFPPCLWNNEGRTPGQVIEQVWFAGVHSDVGGWYDERGLSNTAFQWMLGKAKDQGLKVDDAVAAQFAPNSHDQIHESYDGFWIFRGDEPRQIPEGARIHKSVFERKNKAANKYAPKNLPQGYVEVD